MAAPNSGGFTWGDAGAMAPAFMELLGGYTKASEMRAQAKMIKAAAHRNMQIEADNVERIRQASRAFTSQQIANYGASGAQLSGSVIDVISQDAVQAELEAMVAADVAQYDYNHQRRVARMTRQAADGAISGAWASFALQASSTYMDRHPDKPKANSPGRKAGVPVRASSPTMGPGTGGPMILRRAGS